MNKSSTAYLFKCYIWLVNTITRGPISLAAINDKWLHATVNEYKTDSIPDSTFHRWRKMVESLFDITIKCNSQGEYYIEEIDTLRGADFRSRMFSLLSLNNLLQDCTNLRDKIIFEPISAGEEHLTTVIESMRDRYILQIQYHSFAYTSPHHYQIEPYCLKMYRQRWYIIAYSHYHNSIRHFALDRILSLSTIQKTYIIPEDFDAEEYFRNICGVTLTKDNAELEQITVAVNAQEVPYIRTLPLHSSQKEIETTPSRSVFTYCLTPNEEFYRELRAYGANLVVLSPDWLRKEFEAEALSIYNNYKSDSLT